MASVQWIKLTTDMFDNRKIKHLRKLPEGNNIVLIWVMLLTMAGRCNANGMIFLTQDIPYTTKMLADEMDFEENTIVLALSVLEQLNMIITDNKYLTIAGWQEYQNIEGMDKIREQNRIRKRSQREREKMLLTDSHVTSRDSHATDKDIDKEEDKNKSFNNLSKDKLYSSEVLKDTSKLVIELILNDKSYYPLYEKDVAYYQDLYPAVDVISEFKKMKGWLEANPKNRKTKRGIRTFINNWLSRNQDKYHVKTAQSGLPDWYKETDVEPLTDEEKAALESIKNGTFYDN